MFATLRNRLIFSHMLPLLIIIPLIGAALVVALETEVILPSMSRELAGDAVILTGVIKNEPTWQADPARLHALLLSMHPQLSKRLMVLSPEGRLLASSDPNDADRLGQILELELLKSPPLDALAVNTDFSQRLHGDVVDVLSPVPALGGGLFGYVRVTSRYTTIADEFLQLRYLIGLVMAAGLLLGVVLGSALAVNIGAPIQRVTQAVTSLAQAERRDALPEHGPREVRLLTRAVNALVERLRALEQARRQLLANLVHELGRPLGSLRMAAQVLLQGSKDDPQQLDELLLGMDHELAGLQRLLDDLAHLHDQVLGPLELDRQSIRISEWLPSILHSWQKAARQKGLAWGVTIPPGLPKLYVDPTRLTQMIGNLLSNAIKFTPPGGKVDVSAGVDGAKFWLCVSDTGLGIPSEDQDKLFTPFYRGVQAAKMSEGLGLGLSITRDLAQAHGGTIVVDSRSGQGSRFTILLPLK